MKQLSAKDRAFLARHRRLKADDDQQERPVVGSDTKKNVDVACREVFRTGGAVKLFDGCREEFVPLSQVNDNGNGTWSMPEWLAHKKGFI